MCEDFTGTCSLLSEQKCKVRKEKWCMKQGREDRNKTQILNWM
jgi:hypothetical protein